MKESIFISGPLKDDAILKNFQKKKKRPVKSQTREKEQISMDFFLLNLHLQLYIIKLCLSSCKGVFFLNIFFKYFTMT